MVAIVSGDSLGLLNSSRNILGGSGQSGSSSTGSSGEQVFVNSATGNLVIQDRDETLTGIGIRSSLIRTYNSQGFLDDDNGDNWRLGVHQHLSGLTGTVNTSGSTITKTFGDGAQVVYTYSTALSRYLSTQGDGAHDSLAYDAGSSEWTWTDGSSRNTEIYNASGRLISTLDEDGNAAAYTYTGNLLTNVTDGSGQETFFDYTGNNLTTIRVVSNSVTQTLTRYTYDGQDRLSQVKVDLSPASDGISDGNVYVTTYTYDGTSRRVASISQSDGTSVSFTYQEIEGSYRVKTFTDGAGNVTTLTYVHTTEGTGGGGGTPGVSTEIAIESPIGLVTTLTNDSSGRLIGAQGPAMGSSHLKTQFGYDVDGNVISITTDPSGLNRVTTLGYDTNGNLTLSRDARGNTVSRTYSSTNQLLTETLYTTADPDGAGSGQPSGALTTRYAYDLEDHLRFVVGAEGRVSERRYSSAGLLTASIQYTDAVYDLSGVSATTALTESQLTTWAAARAQTSLQRVDYAYDFRGNISIATAYASTDSSGDGVSVGASITHYVYDQRGQLLQEIDPRGEATTSVADDYLTLLTYDGLGRVLSRTQWESTGVTRTTLSEYDDANHQTEITVANGLIETRTFDGAGRLLSVTRSQGVQPLGTTTYDYDSDGRLHRVTDPTGVSTQVVYDASGRKQFDIDGDGTLTEYVYDGGSNLIKTIQYAALANTSLLVDGSNEPLDNVDVAALRTSASGSPTNDRIVRAVYDEANRLVFTIDQDGAVTETRYDGASRATDVITYATRVTISAGTGEVSVATLTGLLSTSTDDRRSRNFYDAEGNLRGSLDAAGYLVEYEYDAAGQLIRTIGYATATPSGQRASGMLADLRPSADATNDVIGYFFYDGQGRQVGVLDGERYLTETVYDASGNVALSIRYDVRRTYTPGATLDSLRPASLGVSQTRAYLYDGNGRLIEETNPEGTVTRYTYDSVGNLVEVTHALATAEVRNTQARYDAMGRLVAELTAEGSAQITSGMTQAQVDAVWAQHSISHQYDLAGRRISTTDQNGNRTLFFYDADSRVTHTVNALGEVAEKRYNALNQLSESISYSNRISTSGLSGGLVNATLTSRVNAAADASKDAKTTLTYTLTGRLATTTTAEGNQVTYTYNAFGNQTQKVEALDSTHSLTHAFTYDARGQLTKTQWDPTGFNTSRDNTYDAFGRVASTTDANGKITQFTYDRRGQVVTTVDRLNGTRHTAYDAFGRVLTTTDALNNTTAFTYDDATRSVVVTTPEGISLTTVRNRHGQAATVTDGRGYVTSYQYDANGRLSQVFDSLGMINEQTYDHAGRLLTVKDGNEVVTTIAYDAANRVFTRTVDSGSGGLALTTTYAYDGQGRTVDTTDARGIVTRAEYDRDGHIAAVITDYGSSPHLNLRTEYQYDDAGRMLLVTEGAGSANPRVTQYTYDTLGRRTSEVLDPGAGKLNLTTSYEYDKNGNVVRKIDARLNATRFIYDAEERLIYTVDALGGVTKNDYDAEGRTARVRRYSTAVNVASLPASGVTTAGQLEALLTSVSTDVVQQTIYDRDGRQIYVIDAMGGVTQKEYDASGNVVRIHIYSEKIADGTYATPASVTSALATVSDGNLDNDREVRSVYDARNRATFTLDGQGAVARNTFDDVGNLIARTEFAILRTNSGVPNLATMETWAATASNLDAEHDRATRMWYDGANRLVFTRDAEGHITERRYDDVGNITGEMAYAAAVEVAANATLGDVAALAAAHLDPAHDQLTTRVFDGAGRVTSLTDAELHTESFTYDAVGNRLTMTNKRQQTWTYVYDANRRLLEEHSPVVTITTVSDSGGTLVPGTTSASLITKMTYDALGNVTSRTEAFGRPEARTTGYVYDALGRQTRVNLPQINIYNSAADSLARAGTAVVREETAASPYSETTYDALGRAVMNRDVAGNYSHKAYDKLGRLLYEVDAERFVTRYTYDTFGNKTDITRFGNKLNSSGITVSTILSATVVASRIIVSSTQDRTVHTDYDRANRVVSVTQPSVLNFEPFYATPITQQFTVGAQTTYQYDAFGNVIREARLVNPGINYWAETFSFYNRRGELSARVDPLGYVTTYEYDATGHLSRQLEYAMRLLTSWGLEGFDAPTPSTPAGSPDNAFGYDRDLRVSYDRMGRRLAETLVGFEYNQVSGQTVTKIVADRVTSYGYDEVGNRTRTTDPAGASTFTYYDALGRAVAIAQPTKDKGDGTFVTPLTQLGRDVFGNLTVQTERFNGASAATATSYTSGAASGSDRTSYVQYDAYSHVIRSQDATGATRFASYNIRGDVAKDWQHVTDNNGVVSTQVTVHEYDKLGQQTATVEPQKLGTGSVTVRTESRYNAFGEVTARGTNGSFIEYFDYDQAGRVWRTNSGDGVDRAYLYNLAGQATAEIKYEGYPLSIYPSIQTILTLDPDYVLRTNTRYDLNGNVVDQALPGFHGGTEVFVPDDTKALYANFRLGDIDVPNNPAAVYRQVVVGSSVEFVVDPNATLDQDGGYYYNGTTWVQDPSYELVTSRYVYWTTTPDSITPTKTFEYRLTSDPNGPWQSLTVQTLPGGRYGVNVEGIDGGEYEYRVHYTLPDSSELYAQATGTMTLTGTPFITPSLRPDLLDDAGSIPPITLRPPLITTTPGTQSVSASVISTSQVSDYWFYGTVYFSGTNEVKVSFPNFDGPVQIELEYWTVPTPEDGPQYPSALRTITLYFENARAAAMGLAMVWEDPNPLRSAGGISSVSKVRVYSDESGQLLYQSGTSVAEQIESTRSTVLQWKAPRDASVVPSFQVRRVGATNWLGLTVEREGRYFTVDTGKLANGDWEYQVSYTRDNTLTAAAEGVLSLAGGSVQTDWSEEEESTFTTEPIAPVQVTDTPAGDPIDASVENSAHPVVSGGVEYVDGFELQPTLSWSGPNYVFVEWEDDLSAGPVRIELDYISGRKPTYVSDGGVPPRWRLTGSEAGIARTRTFDVVDAETYASLEWTDSDANGGLSSVEAIRIYAQDGGGNWVLHSSRDMSMPPPGRILFWDEPQGGPRVQVEISPAGEDEWARFETSNFYYQDSGRIGVDLSGLAEGSYDYRITYSFIDEETGVGRLYSRSTGLISIPTASSGDPVSVTQNTLLFPDNEGDVGQIVADGTTLSWNRSPQVGTSVLVRYRQEGTTTWQQTTPQGTAPNLYVDLGPGHVEYEILYYRADPLVPYARATGVLNPGAASEPWPESPIPPIFAANVGPVEIDPEWESAWQNSDGEVYEVIGNSIIDYFPATTTWEGSNYIPLTWESLGASVPVRVVLEYTTADRYTPSYGWYEDEVPDRWSPWGDQVGGVARTRTFEFSNADTGVDLEWEDDPDGRDGGISAIDRVKVYIQNSQGDWVLKYDRDGAAPVGGKSIYWRTVDVWGLTPVLRVKPTGTDEWVRIPVTQQSYQFHAGDLAGLGAGTYDYLLTYERDGVPTSNATGVITILSAADGGMISVTQSNVTLYDDVDDLSGDLGDMGLVVANGNEIAWTREPELGDTIVVRTRVNGTVSWESHTIAGTGPDFTFEVAGADLAAVDYEIVYIRDGETEPYARSIGTVNRRAAVIVNPARLTFTQVSTFETEPLPVEGVRVTADKVSWTSPAEAGSTVTFRYRAVEDTVWTELTVTTETNGFSVDPTALALGTYVYEIEYVRSGETEPYVLGSGTMIMRRVMRGGTPLIDETTQQTGEYVFIEAMSKQQYDRWGNALVVTDATNMSTGYRYNQLDEIVRVTQAWTPIVNTQGGTVTTGGGAVQLFNYYDLQGRLIGTKDGNGNVNGAAYNAAGEKTRELHADGGVREYVYDTFGNQVLIKDELGFRTRQTFDAAGRLVQTQRELVAGGLESGVAANVITETFDYDESGQRISETNGEGETTRYYYNLNGDVIRRVSPRGFETTYEYDQHGRKTRETDANGNYQTWTNDDWGRVESHRDLGGINTNYDYDYIGRLSYQSSGLGQSIYYDYDNKGRLVEISDYGNANGTARSQGILSSRRNTQYEYDDAGRRIHERVTVDDLVHVDTRISYDSQGRMTRVFGIGYQVDYSYDAAGSRTRINALYYDHQRNNRTEDLWYTYDSMNRVLTSQGVNSGGTIGINTAQGLQLTYNVAGQRTSATTYGTHITYTQGWDWSEGWPVPVSSYSAGSGYVTEQYGYDGAGRLTSTDQVISTYIDGTPGTDALRTNTRSYDKAGRELVESTVSVDSNSLSTRVRRNSYDDDGRMYQQSTTKNGQLESVVTYGDAVYTSGYYADAYWGEYYEYAFWTQGYDAAGILRSYSVAVYDKGAYKYTTTYSIDYRLGASYQQVTERASSSTPARGVTAPLPGSTRYVYNVNGELVQFIDEKDSLRNRYFANNADGQAVTVVQGSFSAAGQVQVAMRDALLNPDNRVKSQYFYFANGQAIGSFGQLTSENGAMEANFDVNYTPISSGYPASVPSQVIVQTGDTLRLIAARVFGDANLWYVIAEENGLTDPDAPLTEGLVLQIPSEVVSLSNTSNSFKPFDISDALGDTTPTQPAPPPPRKKKGCGVLGQIIIIVVAIIVTIYTAGAAAGALGAAAGSTAGTFAAGTAVLTGTSALGAGAAFTAAAIGGAVGSIASQAVGMALGVQDQFSWKAVGLAAIGSGVGAGLGAAGPVKEVVGLVSKGNLFVAGAMNAAAGSMLTQGLAVATGLQSSFSWRDVAISAVSAPITAAVGGKLGGALGGSKFANDVASGITGSLVRASFGGKIDAANVLADAFGTALGNSIVDKVIALDSPQARRERGSSGSSARRAEREPLVIPEPTFSDPVINLNPGTDVPAFKPTEDDKRNASSSQQTQTVQQASQAAVAEAEVIAEIVVTARAMTQDEQRAYDMRLSLGTLLKTLADSRKPSEDARMQVEGDMGIGHRMLVGLGGIMYGAYDTAKSGVLALKDLAVAGYELNQRLVGDLLHGDVGQLAADVADVWGVTKDKATVLLQGMQNIATVMQDPQSREMLVSFAKEYYGTSSQVTQTELLGALPMELLIAAGTAGAGTVLKSAGIAERIGATLGELATALRAIEVRSPLIPLGPGEMGSMGIKGLQNPFRPAGSSGPGIDYGSLDTLGRPSGVRAVVTSEMLDTGTEASRSIRPPGFLGGAENQARGHLLANRLGGAGDVPENLVTIQQYPANSPVMRGFEADVYNAVSGGQTVRYSATPIYRGDALVPRGITLIGQGSNGFDMAVTVLNPTKGR